MRGIFNKKNIKVTQSYLLNNDHSQNSPHNSADFIDNAKISTDTKLGSHFSLIKSTHISEANQEAFDLETYKKFLSFLKFEEMMEKYNT